MLPYLAVFLISTVLFEAGKAAENSRHGRFLSCAFYLFAIIPLCALAGARDLSIGTDTGGYGFFVYQQGLFADSFSSYLGVLDASSWDIAPLYAFASYAVIKLFDSQFLYFFFVELAVVVPVFLAAKRVCERRLGPLMLLWMFILYIPSLNMMRQSVAIGLVLLAVMDAMEGRRVRAVVLEVLAVLTHTSAIVGAAFWLAWHAFFRRKADGDGWEYRKWAQPLMLLSVIAVLVCVLFFRELAGLFAGLDSVGRLFAYATHSGDEFGTSGALFVAGLTIGAILMLAQVDSARRLKGVYFAYLVALSVPFFALSGLDNTISRMTAYCIIFIIPYVGLSLGHFAKSCYPTGLWIVAAFCAFRFFVCFVWQGFNDAVPYTSALIGIS